MSNKLIENRLRRLEGQVVSLREHITEGASCELMIPQFLAVKGAFNAAFEAYVKDSLAECPAKEMEQRDRLIAMLIKS
ncbi:MAG TPA: metal-sensing transcriptional repressor [Candidatus Paceibacterota bacterium]